MSDSQDTGAPETGEQVTTNPPANTANTANTANAPIQLPDTHPLVKAYQAQKDEIKQLKVAAGTNTDLAAQVEAITAELAATKTEALKQAILTEHKLTKEDAVFLTGDEDNMRAIAARIAQVPPPVNTALGNSPIAPSSTAKLFADFFQTNLGV